jgi:hypothetical protein
MIRAALLAAALLLAPPTARAADPLQPRPVQVGNRSA